MSAELARRHASGVADLDRLPIFRSLRRDELERLTEPADLREVAGGETIVAQWDASKDFYVVLAGTVDVSVEGERIRALGPGEFFGELAALDWGSGFGYPRLATVTAASDVRLLRVPCEVLNDLVRSTRTSSARSTAWRASGCASPST